MNGNLSAILNKCGLNIHGFCPLKDVGELLPTRNRNKIPENAKTVISFLFPYNIKFKGERNLSLYCLSLDYHDIILKKLLLMEQH